MPDLTSIIASAVDNATGGGDDATADTGHSDVDTSAAPTDAGHTDAAVAASPSAGDTGVSDTAGASADAAVAAEAAPVDQVTKDLEELGLKAPKEGERENRLPHSRVKKIAENYGKKVEAKFTQELTEVRAKLAATEETTRVMNNINHLIDTDPDTFMARLTAINPAFKKYVPGAAAEAKPQQAAPAADTPKPGPDMKFDDGSTGYSPEGLDKLLSWNADQAVKQALAKAEETFTKRFGPIEERWKTDQLTAERLPGIRARIATAKETWGKPFEDDYNLGDKSEILQFMKANPDVPFDTAVARILLPKARVDVNTMRANILKEINTARPAAAAKAAPAATNGNVAPAGPRPLEDVIRESMATLK
jgi:hypothetical protein